MDLQTFRALLTDEGQSLLAAAMRDDGSAGESGPRSEWGSGHPAALVAAASEQVRLRGLASAKFGEYAPHMYFTPDSVELSSHLAVAEYKLGRVLHEIGVVLIEAICLGSGADALVLSWSHHTTAVDTDPLTVEMAEANGRAMDTRMFFPAREDISGFNSQGEADFIDLMRPPGPDGSHDPESYSPPLSWALKRVRTTGGGWIRLTPGLAPGAVPDLGRADEAEWISYDGAIQEMVLWYGLGEWGKPPPVTARRATLLPAGASLTGRGLSEPAVRPPGRYVYVPDPAVVHAGLLAEVAEDIGGGLLDGGGTLLTSDYARHTPFATAYEVTDVRPRDGQDLWADADAPEAPYGPGARAAFAVDAAAGPATLTAVPVRFPQEP
ncbi:SAM-dependent methyltransferase [Streptomyces sp. NBC_01408]|uniref:SAM-dependent methyltransferase n=1 Tax=Streptomyces sp. NBC_01408 TaxID=2903855 RepID=UPI0022535114|nr:SAM-dependent methyltransferase [Streptomyces sp. NBC_01408]MCX4696152.1 SAM-dependent methyltransferase [Streptomyces sp. NBC_01408]